MIRLSVLYPQSDDATFDHDYYRTKHVPLAVEKWKPKVAEIDRGINGPYVAAVHFTFESDEAMQAALAAPDTAAIQADVANYTNISPVMQISSIEG